MLKRWIRQLWDVLSSKDPSAEKIVLHPRDPASVETLFQEITSPSLFSATRLVVANAVRPIKRTIPLEALASHLSAMPERTVFIMAVEGMTPLDEEMDVLLRGRAGGERPGMEVTVWRPYDRGQLLAIAREIMVPLVVRADSETLLFWLHRIG